MAQAEVLTKPQRPPGRVADPCIMVIFGAAGDLTRRKLIPALYNLAKAELLSHEFAILGVAHNPMSDDDFRRKLTDEIKSMRADEVDREIWEWFDQRLYYITGDFGDKNIYSSSRLRSKSSTKSTPLTEIISFIWLLRPISSAPSSSNSPPSV